jgi:hypothetical protein
VHVMGLITGGGAAEECMWRPGVRHVDTIFPVLPLCFLCGIEFCWREKEYCLVQMYQRRRRRLPMVEIPSHHHVAVHTSYVETKAMVHCHHFNMVGARLKSCGATIAAPSSKCATSSISVRSTKLKGRNP